MTFLARIDLEESAARALAEAASEDADLGWPSVAMSELASGFWSVEIYLETRLDAKTRAVLARLAGKSAAFRIAGLPEANWVRKSLEGLKPVRAGRFLIHGAHDRAVRKANDVAIEIEAGEAFGTGHHGTTAGCLGEIGRLARIRPFRKPLDIGTGSGVLAIAMAKLWRRPVIATDIDPVAVRVAGDNARINGVAGHVRLLVAGTLDRREISAGAPYDLILANILAGPLQALARPIRRIVAPGGFAVLSGLLPGQKARIVSAYRRTGLVLAHASVLDGWLTLTFRRDGKTGARSAKTSRL